MELVDLFSVALVLFGDRIALAEMPLLAANWTSEFNNSATSLFNILSTSSSLNFFS
jgi:hypothetical protein